MPVARRTFSDERSPGTFCSLGALPKRASPRKSPIFHIAHDDDDEHSSSLDEHPLHVAPPAIVRFPCSGSDSASPSRPSSPSSNARLTPPRPQLPRGTSVPILLSNGKPLKSSLKSSSSSPAMLIPTQMHFRTCSEPSTPKNVHFPETDYALATVRVFNRSARPAALSNPANGNGDETETEGEDTPPLRIPFPPISPVFNYEIDPTTSSSVPCRSCPLFNLLLESLHLSSPSFLKPLLTGSILVRNLAFEKHVAIRFTLDDWHTVSEVGAHYVDSLSHIPRLVPSSIPGDTAERGWDRFTFTIRLEDYAPSLSTRTLWLAVRYHVDSTYPEPGSALCGPGGEWWDNNDGKNYRVGFRPAVPAPTPLRNKPRQGTISAPISSRPPPPTTCREHILGLMVPSLPNKKDDRCLSPLLAGKLSLCNYVPPIVRAAPSISISSADLSSSSLVTKTVSPPQSGSDDDTLSPVSSTLSTPTASPTIVPRVLIDGQSATSTYSPSQKEDIHSRPGHIADWDWSAPNKQQAGLLSRQHAGLVPGLEPRRQRDNLTLHGENILSESNPLYDAFVTRWCFAQEPSPNHHTYDGGITV